MKKKQGFTLTEILLAVLIVGIIAVALASLTTASSREAGKGRSRVVLRNSLSLVLRQIRHDVMSSSQLLYARGVLGSVTPATLNDIGPIPLLVLAKNTTFEEVALPNASARYVAYCFKRGTVTTLSNGNAIIPMANSYAVPATDEGIIYRKEFTTKPDWSDSTAANYACKGLQTTNEVLDHVKYIDQVGIYHAPYFGVMGAADGAYNVADGAIPSAANIGSRLEVKLIVEVPSFPVVNEVTESIFSLPNGFADSRVS